MAKTSLEYNIVAHDKIAKTYEQIHGEIYNEVEQARLKASLSLALSYVQTENIPIKALDFGCGAGNLTKHLTDLGCAVTASDVSKGFLNLVTSRLYAMPVTTVMLNGVNLSNIPDSSFDFIATYSVLHHVPDYLSLMKEFARVLKKGGVLYIDHESSSSIWNKGEKYKQFLVDIKKYSRLDIKKFFIFTNYIDRIIRTLFNPKYQREGDIHVFIDDHIEWNNIRTELAGVGVSCVYEKDYLLFKRTYNKEVYEEYKEEVDDMHVLIGRKE